MANTTPAKTTKPEQKKENKAVFYGTDENGNKFICAPGSKHVKDHVEKKK